MRVYAHSKALGKRVPFIRILTIKSFFFVTTHFYRFICSLLTLKILLDIKITLVEKRFWYIFTDRYICNT